MSDEREFKREFTRSRLTVVIRDDVKIEAQVRALREGTTVTTIVERLLAAWVMGRVETPEEAEEKLEPANEVVTELVVA